MKCWQASVQWLNELQWLNICFFFYIHPHFVTFSLKLVSNLLQNKSALDFVALHCPSIWWLFLPNWFQIFLLIICEILSFCTRPSLILTVDHFSRIQPTHSRTKFPQKICAFHFFKTDLERIHSSSKSQKEIGRQNLEKLTKSINKAYQQKNVRKKTPNMMIDDDVWDAEWIVNRVSTSFEWVTSETDLSQNYTPAGRCTI